MSGSYRVFASVQEALAAFDGHEREYPRNMAVIAVEVILPPEGVDGEVITLGAIDYPQHALQHAADWLKDHGRTPPMVRVKMDSASDLAREREARQAAERNAREKEEDAAKARQILHGFLCERAADEGWNEDRWDEEAARCGLDPDLYPMLADEDDTDDEDDREPDEDDTDDEDA